METGNLHLALRKYAEKLKVETWLKHPVKCICEICLSENIP